MDSLFVEPALEFHGGHHVTQQSDPEGLASSGSGSSQQRPKRSRSASKASGVPANLPREPQTTPPPPLSKSILPHHRPRLTSLSKTANYVSHILLILSTLCFLAALNIYPFPMLMSLPISYGAPVLQLWRGPFDSAKNYFALYGTVPGGIQSDLDKWIAEESTFAQLAILANIGPACGAADGLIIASPSWGEWADEPDYYYTWTRDSALTISSLLPGFLPPSYLSPWTYPGDSNLSFTLLQPDQPQPLLETLIRAYVSSQIPMQVRENPSGDHWSGGLNEPKFHVDGSPFEGDWGRPQRDGPALRALALIPYAHFLLDRAWPADIAYVRSHLYDIHEIRQEGKVIKNDLEEVGGGWWLPGFDLWEEVDGHHLFTLLLSLRALQAGTTLATRLNDTAAAEYYSTQAGKVQAILPRFWSNWGYWAASTTKSMEVVSLEHISGDSPSHLGSGDEVDLTLTTKPEEVRFIGEKLNRERSGLDCAFPLSIIHAGDRPSASESSGLGDDENEFHGLFSPSNPRTLATLREYILSFEGVYRINDGRDWTEGWALGRYAEDIYNGVGISRGNPWFLCTFSLAHTLYLTQSSFLTEGSIELTNLTRPFWSDILNDPALLEYIPDTDCLANKASDRPSMAWWKPWSPGTDPSAHGVCGNTWQAGSKEFNRAIKRLGEVGDAFMNVGRRYATEEGRMSEQIDRSDGSQIGARDLTWSYASFVDAARAREEVKRGCKIQRGG